MNQQALEAVIQKEATFLHKLADECERSGLEYGKGRANGIRETIASIRAALTADDAASGERVVWYNGPASGYTIVIDDWMRKTFTEVGPRQITIEVRGEELFVRKVRGG